MAQPSLDHPWPQVESAKQLSLVARNHPVVGLMAAVDKTACDTNTDVANRRCHQQHSPLAKQLSEAIVAYTSPAERIGFEFFCLLPSSGHYPDRLACHPLLLVRIRPDSPLTRDWHRGTTAARACHRMLKSFNLNDIHCLIVEGSDALRSGGGGGGGRGGDGDGADDTTDPDADVRLVPVSYHIGERDYYEAWLPEREMLSLTSHPGRAIASIARPDISGTLGFTILLEVDIQPQGGTVHTENNSSSRPITRPTAIAKLFLTCRHVVDDSDKTSSSKDIDRLSDVVRCSLDSGSHFGRDSASNSIDAIQLDQGRFDSLLESARVAKNEKSEALGAVHDSGNEGVQLTDVERSLRDRLKRDCCALETFISHLERLRDPESRRIGTVVLSPPLTGPDAINDWALILSRVSSPDPAGCNNGVVDPSCANINGGTDPNLFWIKELSASARERLRRLNTQGMHTVTGASRSRLLPRDFMKLKTYFTQDTIDQHCCSAIKTNQQSVTHYTQDELLMHLGSPDSMDVYHVGAEGTGHGRLSHIKSHTFTGSASQDTAYEYCILGHNGKPFSNKGDSGAAIFGILPPLPPANSSPAAGADTDKDAQVGVLGLLRAGRELRGRHITSDVTYAIPIETVMEKVEERGRVLNWAPV